MINSKIFERLDLSNKLWSQFNVRDTLTEKQLGLYETESIHDPNIVTFLFDPKEQRFLKNIEKKFQSLNDFTNKKVKKIQQNRFEINIPERECRLYPKVNLLD